MFSDTSSLEHRLSSPGKTRHRLPAFSAESPPFTKVTETWETKEILATSKAQLILLILIGFRPHLLSQISSNSRHLSLHSTCHENAGVYRLVERGRDRGPDRLLQVSWVTRPSIFATPSVPLRWPLIPLAVHCCCSAAHEIIPSGLIGDTWAWGSF